MIKVVKIFIGTIPKTHLFVELNSKHDCIVDVLSDRYVVDGKSILGVFSIDLIHPFLVRLDGEESDINELIREYYAKSLIYE